MALGDALTVELALPLAEVHLAEIGLDARLDAEASGEWRSRLHRAPQRRHVQGVDDMACQPVGEQLRLPLALRRQCRVAVPVDAGERPAGHHRLGLAVADEQQLGRTRRPPKPRLPILAGLLDGHDAGP